MEYSLLKNSIFHITCDAMAAPPLSDVVNASVLAVCALDEQSFTKSYISMVVVVVTVAVEISHTHAH